MIAREKRPKSKLIHITPERYRELRERLGFTPASAARFFGADARTERRWSGEPAGPPAPVITCFALMIGRGIKAADAEQLAAMAREVVHGRRR